MTCQTPSANPPAAPSAPAAQSQTVLRRRAAVPPLEFKEGRWVACSLGLDDNIVNAMTIYRPKGLRHYQKIHPKSAIYIALSVLLSITYERQVRLVTIGVTIALLICVLKITIQTKPTAIALKLEGAIAGNWVPDPAQLWQRRRWITKIIHRLARSHARRQRRQKSFGRNL